MKHQREWYIPKGATKVTAKAADAVFYLYDAADGKPAAMAFLGKAQKPSWRYRFGSPKARERHIASSIEGRAKANARRAERRAERNKPHSWEKGLILYTSWGYEQTNTEFYEIVDVPSPCYVTLQEIGTSAVAGSQISHGMAESRMPDPTKKIGEPFKRKVDMAGTPSVKIGTCQTAWLWDGKQKYTSWYA